MLVFHGFSIGSTACWLGGWAVSPSCVGHTPSPYPTLCMEFHCHVRLISIQYVHYFVYANDSHSWTKQCTDYFSYLPWDNNWTFNCWTFCVFICNSVQDLWPVRSNYSFIALCYSSLNVRWFDTHSQNPNIHWSLFGSSSSPQGFLNAFWMAGLSGSPAFGNGSAFLSQCFPFSR